MNKPSILYANAVISVRKSLLLNNDRTRRMISAPSFLDAARVLVECGYDENTVMHSGGHTHLIVNSEYEKTIILFKQLCPDENVWNCIAAKYDYHNASVLYKSRFAKVELNETTYPFGNLELTKLKNAMINKDYKSLPHFMKESLTKLDAMTAPAAHEIETEFNNAMQSEIKKHAQRIKDKAISNFFITDQQYNRFSANTAKDNVFSLDMLLNWFILKQEEFKTVKIILMGKKLELSREQIRDMMRGINEKSN